MHSLCGVKHVILIYLHAIYLNSYFNAMVIC